MKMKTFTEKQLSGILILGIIVTLGTYVYFYYKIVSMSQKIGDLRLELSEVKSKKNEFELIRQNMKSTFGDYSLIQKMFVSKEGVVDFIQMIENLAKEKNLNIQINTVQNKIIDQQILNRERLEIFLTVAGSREDALVFLKLLENIPFKMNVQNVLFDKGDTDEGNKDKDKVLVGSWKMSLNIDVLKEK